jgi:hypothetical protein
LDLVIPLLVGGGKAAIYFPHTSTSRRACRSLLYRAGGLESTKLVKCAMSWVATYQNCGHECFEFPISKIVTDPLSEPAWDASQNPADGDGGPKDEDHEATVIRIRHEACEMRSPASKLEDGTSHVDC